jgi:hypothetical protein
MPHHTIAQVGSRGASSLPSPMTCWEGSTDFSELIADLASSIDRTATYWLENSSDCRNLAGLRINHVRFTWLLLAAKQSLTIDAK